MIPTAEQYRPRLAYLVRVYFCVAIAMSPLGACTCEDKVRSIVDDKEERKSLIDAGKKLSSQPTEFEPNNTPENASPIVLKKELRGTLATIATPGDVDWYVVRSESEVDEVVELHVEPAEELNVSVHLEIQGVDALPLTYNVAEKGKAEIVKSYLLPAGSAVRFAVRGEDETTGRYTISFVRQLSAGAYESEPNDVPAVAHPLALPGEIQGGFDRPGDRDVYALQFAQPTPDKDGTPVFSFEYVPAANVPQVVRLYDHEAFEEPLLTLQVPGTPSTRARIPNMTVPVGVEKLWLVLTAAEGYDRSSAYLIRLIQMPQVASNVELEPNDRKPQPVASPVELAGFLHSPDDVDMFLVGVAAEKSTVDAGRSDAPEPVELSDVGPDADMGTASDAGVAPGWDALPEKVATGTSIRVELEPVRDGVEVGLRWSSPAGEFDIKPTLGSRSSVICGRPYVPGEVELSVRALSLETGPGQRPAVDYRLKISEENAATGFEIEPNDSRQSADTLKVPGQGYILDSKDIDVWGFAIQPESGLESAKVTLKISAKLSTRLRGRVVDSEGGLVAELPAAVSNERALSLDLPGGLYFVELSSDAGGGCDAYRVELMR